MRFGLQKKLLILIVVIVISIDAVIGIVTMNMMGKISENTASNKIVSLTEAAVSQVKGATESDLTVLRTIASMPVMCNPKVPVKEKNQQITAILKAGIAKYEYFLFFDVNGESDNGFKYDKIDYFKNTILVREAVSEPFINQQTHIPYMTFSVPVISNEGQVIGALVANARGNRIDGIASIVQVGGSKQIVHPSFVNYKTRRILGNGVLQQGGPGPNAGPGGPGGPKPEGAPEGKGGSKPSGAPEGKGGPGPKAAPAAPVSNGMPVYDSTKAVNHLLGEMKNGSLPYTILNDPVTGEKIIAYGIPMPNNPDWAVLTVVPYSEFYGAIDGLRIILGIVLVVALVISCLVAGIFIRNMTVPLQKVKVSMDAISAGNADLTKRIDIRAKDEIGDVVKGFNKFIDMLQDIVKDIKATKDKLNSAGNDLNISTQETASSITEIIANIKSVHEQITSQSTSVTETAGAVNQIASNIESLEKMIENQSTGVNQASFAVEEMMGNIASVNNSVDKMANSFAALIESAQSGTELQEDVNIRIEEIKNQSETLQEANQAIAAIAEQTNLLAMNAAIEAAHAGEAGKGFSVVADEIRKLSETSSAQSKTIGDQLSNIRNSIESVVGASEQSSKAFQTVADNIHTTDEIVRQIKAAMEEQNQGSKQINQALHSMNDSTMEVKNASKEMSEGNRAILEEVRLLQESTVVMKQSIDEMAAGAHKIDETGTTLTNISGNMEDSIKEIGEQVDKFRV